MPRPIRVSVVYKTQFPTSRHRACEIKFSLTCFHENLNRMADSRKIKQKKCPLRKVEGFSMRRGWKCGRFFVRLKVKRKGGSEWISSKSDDLSPPSESVRDLPSGSWRSSFRSATRPSPSGSVEFPKVKDTIPKSTLTLLPEHAVVRLLGIECQFLVTS